MSGLRIGSLCSGYEGLGMAVMSVLGGELAWVADNDPGASAILTHRFPDVKNHGDITGTDWASVEPVDILTAGFPCQDVSCAGRRNGLRAGNRSGVWSHVAVAIGALRPPFVYLENVGGLLSARADSDVEPCTWCLGDPADQPHLRALGAVLGDLAALGYDTQWRCVRAADAGAPHRRERVFILAWPAADTADGGRYALNDGGEPRAHVPQPVGRDAVVAGDDRGSGLTATHPERDRREGCRAASGQDAGWPPATGVGCRPADSGPPAAHPDRATGRERRLPAPGQAAGGRPRADAGRSSGARAADSTGDGWDARRTEPARFVGRPDAAERGHGPAANATGERHGHAGPQGERGIPAATVAGAPANPNGAQPGPDSRGSGEAPSARPGERPGWRGEPGSVVGGGTPADPDGTPGRRHEPRSGPGTVQGAAVAERVPEQPGRLHSGGRDESTMAAADPDGGGRGTEPGSTGRRGSGRVRAEGCEPGDIAWGNYEPAIRRWEAVLRRAAPRPTEPGRTGERLSPRFVEWMQGLPEGWVTDVPGLSRNAQLKALGNGVVPQQAALALSLLLPAWTERAA